MKTMWLQTQKYRTLMKTVKNFETLDQKNLNPKTKNLNPKTAD